MIVAEGLEKRFGESEALCGIDFHVDAGEIVGLLGRNGAGKTTTVNILSTLLVPDNGRATVAGLDVVRDARRVRSLIGLTGQSVALDDCLTGRGNLVMIGRLWRISKHDAAARAEELLQQFDLTTVADRPVKTYSGGTRRRLDLAVGFVGDPLVRFLDEPTTGLDPQSRRAMWESIRDVTGKGATVLLTTQYLEEADQLSDRIIVLDGGRVVAEGTPDELKQKIGGDRVQVTTEPSADSERAAKVLEAFGETQLIVTEAEEVLEVAVDASQRAIPRIVMALSQEGIGVDDVKAVRPTLDDVFLALTGAPMTSSADVDDRDRA